MKIFKYKQHITGGLFKKSGRNLFGRITVAHRGGGFKRKYRSLHFFNISNEFCKYIYTFNFVFFTEYLFFQKLTKEKDPFRSSEINLCQDLQWGFLKYKNLLPSYFNLFKEPSFYFLTKKYQTNYYLNLIPSNSNYISQIPLGGYLKNIEQFPLSGPLFGRAQGSVCSLKRHFTYSSLIEFPSKNFAILSSFVLCTPCNETQYNWLRDTRILLKKKAGYSRWKGKRPTVTGRAKNPIDHPNGGRSGPGGFARTPWGMLAKGPKTSSKIKKKKKILQLKLLLKTSINF